MADALLVLNAGSSSLKFSVFLDDDPPPRVWWGQVEGLPSAPRFAAHDASGGTSHEPWEEGTRLGFEDAIEFLLAWTRDVVAPHRITAVGHRVVHGGTRFSHPTVVDPSVIAELEALVPLAPLHQPHNLAAIKAVARLAPSVTQVACFDTAFHRTMPQLAQMFGLPRAYFDDGVRRYGFHGLSYEYVASVLASCAPAAAHGRMVVAHLGNGASMCAMRRGQSVATTMGFSALDGLVMGTRCGAIDPGVLLHLANSHGMTVTALQQLLYEQSGLLGVSGLASDMRELLASRDSRAAEAVDLFVYRITRELGSLAAALGGIDALVFTGGIGENAPSIRARVCEGASWLGLRLDREANAAGGPRITRADSCASAWVVRTNEELMIAQHTRGRLGIGSRSDQHLRLTR